MGVREGKGNGVEEERMVAKKSERLGPLFYPTLTFVHGLPPPPLASWTNNMSVHIASKALKRLNTFYLISSNKNTVLAMSRECLGMSALTV